MSGIKVALPEIKSFILRCLEKVGAKHEHAESLADVLLAADYKGHYSHGLNRLEMYIRDIEQKMCAVDTEPKIIKETVAIAHVDGNNLLGPVVGTFCMDLAIKKAKQVGIGWVVAKGSNHFGIAGWYSTRAVDQGLLGMAFTNGSPLMVPTRAKQPTLGTNPLSVAAPAKDGDSFMLDMATTTVALGKIEVQKRKGEPIPSGWAMDKQGLVTTDATMAAAAASLMPLGGTEINGGYKGYGLSFMVDIFCGILSGSTYGPNIRQWMNTDTVADLGQCFVAIDPNAFAPGFEDRMSDLLNTCRGLSPAEKDKKVLVPGDPEREKIKFNDEQGGIVYHVNQIKSCHELAKSIGVERMKTQPEI